MDEIKRDAGGIMTLTELLEKLKSNDQRDALAREYGKTGHATFVTIGYDARTKDLELVIKCLEKCIEQRDRWIREVFEEEPSLVIDADNKELKEILNGAK